MNASSPDWQCMDVFGWFFVRTWMSRQGRKVFTGDLCPGSVPLIDAGTASVNRGGDRGGGVVELLAWDGRTRLMMLTGFRV